MAGALAAPNGGLDERAFVEVMTRQVNCYVKRKLPLDPKPETRNLEP
jgi:hypothetical protein